MKFIKEIAEVMMKDITNDRFTKREIVIYGVVVPLAFVLVMAVAGTIEAIAENVY